VEILYKEHENKEKDMNLNFIFIFIRWASKINGVWQACVGVHVIGLNICSGVWVRSLNFSCQKLHKSQLR